MSISLICDSVAAKVAACTEAESKADWQLAELRSAYLGLLTTPDSFKYKNEDDIPDADVLTDMLTEQALQKYEEKNIDEAFSAKEALPEMQAYVRENNKETLAQVFTDIRYTKKNNEFFGKKLWETMQKRGFK